MTETIQGEGPTLSEALQNAVAQLGVSSTDELTWDYVREHFKEGAWTVLVDASLRSAEDLAAARAELASTESAAEWMRTTLALFGSEDATVSTSKNQHRFVVDISSPTDSSLLIGKEGKNLEALQVLLRAAMKKTGGNEEVYVDVDGYRARGGGGGGGSRDDDDRPRGRGRDRDDRGGRGRDDRGGRGRDDRGGRGRDDRGGRGGDRGGRGGERRGRPEKDPARDARIEENARSVAQQVAESGEAVRLGTMNSYERRLAHQAVKDIDGVDSRSVNDGDDKVVEIFQA